MTGRHGKAKATWQGKGDTAGQRRRDSVMGGEDDATA